MIAMALSTLIITGCASNTSNTQKGAGIGAVLGALAGKGTGDNDKSRYVWGAALGALAGSAIGSYMDKQEQEFRDELADSGVEVSREGDSIRLSIPGNITFPNDSAAIVTGFYPVLENVAKVLNRYEKTKLSIEGHTDSVGDASSCRCNEQIVSQITYRALMLKLIVCRRLEWARVNQLQVMITPKVVKKIGVLSYALFQ